MEVLKGMVKTLQRNKPSIVVEFFNEANEEKIRELLCPLGYYCRHHDGNDLFCEHKGEE